MDKKQWLSEVEFKWAFWYIVFWFILQYILTIERHTYRSFPVKCGNIIRHLYKFVHTVKQGNPFSVFSQNGLTFHQLEEQYPLKQAHWSWQMAESETLWKQSLKEKPLWLVDFAMVDTVHKVRSGAVCSRCLFKNFKTSLTCWLCSGWYCPQSEIKCSLLKAVSYTHLTLPTRRTV